LSARLPSIQLAAALLVTACAATCAQTIDVSARVEVVHHTQETSRLGSSAVIVWLTPLQKAASDIPPQKSQQYTLTQKDKQFTPHILVVPIGSSVDFPNLDPFFHNVFSLFNGKRFDLGLYESHTHRTVQFDREGISYIFCNIHPDMGAVVISLATPFFATSTADGMVLLHGVPSGKYRLNVWAENVPLDRLNELSRVVDITPQNSQLGTIHMETSGDVMTHHQNKFGEAYKPLPKQPY
jgi:plastocyanin